MTLQETLDKILPSFQRYYDIIREDVPAPFSAVAEFHSHDEQYFLIKSARLSESDSHEYIYFATVETLDETHCRNWMLRHGTLVFPKYTLIPTIVIPILHFLL